MNPWVNGKPRGKGKPQDNRKLWGNGKPWGNEKVIERPCSAAAKSGAQEPKS